MSLYAHPHVRRSESYFGYAYAYKEIDKHLRNYKHSDKTMHVDINSPKSKTQLYFGSPDGFFYDHQYKIQMTQWESTLVPPHWVEHAKRYDEWWTANQFGADAFINAGVPEKKIKVENRPYTERDRRIWKLSLLRYLFVGLLEWLNSKLIYKELYRIKKKKQGHKYKEGRQWRHLLLENLSSRR